MQQLIDKCVFRNETEASAAVKVNLELLRNYVDRGRARLVPVGPGGLVSVSVKEGSQSDVAGLFCGARTLVINENTGDIYLRGVNKFFDLEDVASDPWMEDPALWQGCTVYAQRKLAGFVVTIGSPDGKRLECMSKHSLAGEHVELASVLLHEGLSRDRQCALARDLHAMEATASCECICLEKDFRHPVRELTCFDRSLVLFSVQKRHHLQEQALPFALVQEKASTWGLRCAQGTRLATPADLHNALRSTHPWRASYEAFNEPTELAEGLVILFELPNSGDLWVRPLRLKAKTTAYITLRSLRSLIRQDSRPRLLLYHKAVAAWAALRAPTLSADAAAAYLEVMEVKGGMSLIEASFRGAVVGVGKDGADYLCRHRRHRDASTTVGEAYRRLLEVTEEQVTRTPPHCHPFVANAGSSAPPQLSMLLFCGLPGSGKTTLCAQVLETLSESPHQHRFGFGIILKKDDITKAVAGQLGITAASSKHKKRRLGMPVHKEVLRRLEVIRLFASMAPSPVLLLFDACNATPQTRQMWCQEISPAQATAAGPHRPFSNSRIVHVECTEPELLALRVGSRRTHELLADAAEGQRALYNVRRLFVPPTPQENALYVDTAGCSPSDAAEGLVNALALLGSELGAVKTPLDEVVRSSLAMQPLTFEQVEQRLSCMEDDLLYSLLGAKGFNPVLSAILNRSSEVKRSRRVVIALVFDEATTKQLRKTTTDALAATLFNSPTIKPAEESVSLMSRWVCSVRDMVLSPFRQRGGASVAERSESPSLVAAGHTRWLAGWLFRGGKHGSALGETVGPALAERFDATGESAPAHLTLLYSADGKTGVSEFWDGSGLKLGDTVAVTVEEILLDRAAVCLSARLAVSQRAHQWPGKAAILAAGAETNDECEMSADESREDGGEERQNAAERERERGPHLHITLGVASGVKSGYCGGMFAMFQEWEAHNVALKKRKEQNAATRSQDKFVNFLQLRLSCPLHVRGTVADIS